MEPLTAEDPRQVSVYHLQARLGAGGMGRVYLGSTPGGRAVAVKVVHPDLARDPEFMARFRREVEAASSVSGVYTAPVVGAGPDDSPPWLATAYVPGPSLADLVRGAGPLPEAAVWRLAAGLTEALQAIHGRSLVHRDLKPGNILIAADGPRVIDFGISRALHEAAITGTQTTMGTPAYMSPEQAGGGEIGPASDVFALGSVLAFAATGTAPFDGGAPLSVIYRIVHAEPDLSALPPALGRLIAGCLVKDPAGRPSLGDLLSAVTAAAAAFPPHAPGQYWPDPVAAVIARQAASVAFSPGANPVTPSSVHLSGATVPPGQPVTPGPQGQMVQPGRRRVGGRWLVLAGAAVAAATVGTVLALVIAPGSAGPTHTTGQGTSPPARSITSATTAAPPGATAAATTTPAAATSAATSPSTTTASPSSSVLAVTVCSDPGSGCRFPGGAQYMQVRPTQISDSGDGSAYLKDLVWTGWGAPEAHATGVQELNTCTPDCASGNYNGYPATVTVTGLTSYGAGLEGYATILIQSSGPVGSATYTKSTTIPT